MLQARWAQTTVWAICLVASLPIAALADAFDERAFVGSERLRVHDQDATATSDSVAAAKSNQDNSQSNQETSMFGLIGQLKAKPGQGEALASILAQGSKNMPGNIAYLVAVDATDSDIIWVTEVWESAEDHKNSLTLDSVREAITRGKPLIEEFIASHPVSPIP